MSHHDPPDARSRILDAAERAFADRGLAGARVASITEEAGVNKAMLYYYFKSKHHLYQAVLERVFDQIVHMAEDVGAHGDAPAPQAIEAFIDGYTRILAEHPHVVRVVLRGLLDSGTDLLSFVGPRLGQVLPLVAGQVARGQAEGALNPRVLAPLVPPTLVAPLVFFALASPVITVATGVPEDELRAAWLTNVREMVLYGLVARPLEER